MLNINMMMADAPRYVTKGAKKEVKEIEDGDELCEFLLGKKQKNG